MPKKKRKSTADLINEGLEEPDKASKSEVEPCVAKCGVCSKKGEISYYDCDPEWELPGHPDHVHRPVCVDCVPGERQRDAVCAAVYDAMRQALDSKGMDSYAVENAVNIAWRSFFVEHDDKELVAMARKLKVKHPWLKGKKSK